MLSTFRNRLRWAIQGQTLPILKKENLCGVHGFLFFPNVADFFLTAIKTTNKGSSDRQSIHHLSKVKARWDRKQCIKI